MSVASLQPSDFVLVQEKLYIGNFWQDHQHPSKNEKHPKSHFACINFYQDESHTIGLHSATLLMRHEATALMKSSPRPF